MLEHFVEHFAMAHFNWPHEPLHCVSIIETLMTKAWQVVLTFSVILLESISGFRVKLNSGMHTKNYQ